MEVGPAAKSCASLPVLLRQTTSRPDALRFPPPPRQDLLQRPGPPVERLEVRVPDCLFVPPLFSVLFW